MGEVPLYRDGGVTGRAQTKTHPPRTLQKDYASGPRRVRGGSQGSALSYERGTVKDIFSSYERGTPVVLKGVLMYRGGGVTGRSDGGEQGYCRALRGHGFL